MSISAAKMITRWCRRVIILGQLGGKITNSFWLLHTHLCVVGDVDLLFVCVCAWMAYRLPLYDTNIFMTFKMFLFNREILDIHMHLLSALLYVYLGTMIQQKHLLMETKFSRDFSTDEEWFYCYKRIKCIKIHWRIKRSSPPAGLNISIHTRLLKNKFPRMGKNVISLFMKILDHPLTCNF